MKKSFKLILYILIILSGFSVIFTNCKENKDPFDNDYPADKWAPEYLLTEVCDSGVWLWWEQAVENIDGFIIERSADSLNWEFLSQRIIEYDIREYLDTTILPGDIRYYRIYARADKNISNYCYSDPIVFPLQMPVVITNDVTNITDYTAILNGGIASDGGNEITERGFIYRETENVESEKKKVDAGKGIGAYIKEITRLRSGISYTVQAYATNKNGTAYGKEKSFTTTGEVSTGCTDWDGKTYKTVTIGSQTWMAENLAYLPSVNKFNSSGTFADTTLYYYVYDYSGTNVTKAKETENYKKYGVLYNWLAALDACPYGYHLPSNEEWSTLEIYLQNNGYNYDDSIDTDNDRSTNNKIAKSLSANSVWWGSYKGTEADAGAIGNDLESNNRSGFTALPGGAFYCNGYVSDIGSHGFWWSSTKYNSTEAWYRTLFWRSSDMGIGTSRFGYTVSAFSVRCVKD